MSSEASTNVKEVKGESPAVPAQPKSPKMSAPKRKHLLTPPRKAVSFIGKMNSQGRTSGDVQEEFSELEFGLYGRLGQAKRLEVEGPVLNGLASGSGLENQGFNQGKVSSGDRETDSAERELWSDFDLETSFGDLGLDSGFFDDPGNKTGLDDHQKVEVGQDLGQGKGSPGLEEGYDAEDEEEMEEESQEEYEEEYEEYEEEYEEYEEEYGEYEDQEEWESEDSEWDEDKTHDVALRGGFKRTPPPSDWDEEQEWYMEAPERDPAFVARRNRLLEALGPAGARLLNMD
ncbi:unnamed protein product [Bursaphelenchus xylophilus]|uniref:(pine wood nematode) hypothetical protein n=1 Tax=Bursaphelenchus xylophilus TaxID=6326 RepID=A0A1I7S261_BURXY|nr:unnamed protein product [Bursaphelenchus xylophilus]CAG9114877.1 unnamed protein product [Bursaphelenchus xylophilus]